MLSKGNVKKLAQSKGVLLYVANYLHLCFIIIVSTTANFEDAV